MESVSLKQVISSTNRRSPINPLRFYTRNRRLHLQNLRFRFPLIRSKQSDFQDFQGYAKPKRLLPATEVKGSTDTSLRGTFSSCNLREPLSFFKVKIQTSNVYGSSLSDLNAGVLLCLIDENGDSILQRIPASSMNCDSTESDDSIDHDRMHFQRGSSDEFTFEGPRLGKLEGLWISLESGQWRLGGVSLTIINACEPLLKEEDEEMIQYIGYCYDFDADDVLLGEGGNTSMLELRPSHVTELSGVNPSTLLAKSISQSTSLLNAQITNEESMKEYADLKFSLLLYDAILILIGTSVASFSVGESSALAFFIGGFSGFLYLLLLQRSIDGLPAPEPISRNLEGNLEGVFGGVKSPLSSIALAIGISFVALKYSSSGDDVLPFVLNPKDLVVGMLGFLACKVAVVLAAFKTLPVSLKENKID